MPRGNKSKGPKMGKIRFEREKKNSSSKSSVQNSEKSYDKGYIRTLSPEFLKERIEECFRQLSIIDDDMDVVEMKFDCADEGRFLSNGMIPIEYKLKKRGTHSAA